MNSVKIYFKQFKKVFFFSQYKFFVDLQVSTGFEKISYGFLVKPSVTSSNSYEDRLNWGLEIPETNIISLFQSFLELLVLTEV